MILISNNPQLDVPAAAVAPPAPAARGHGVALAAARAALPPVNIRPPPPRLHCLGCSRWNFTHLQLASVSIASLHLCLIQFYKAVSSFLATLSGQSPAVLPCVGMFEGSC